MHDGIHNSGYPSDDLEMTPEKACQILKDGTVHDRPLTKAQRGLFGVRCGERDETRNGFRREPNANAFCSTGKGGGVDPSCGKGEGGSVIDKATAVGRGALKAAKTIKKYTWDIGDTAGKYLGPKMLERTAGGIPKGAAVDHGRAADEVSDRAGRGRASHAEAADAHRTAMRAHLRDYYDNDSEDSAERSRYHRFKMMDHERIAGVTRNSGWEDDWFPPELLDPSYIANRCVQDGEEEDMPTENEFLYNKFCATGEGGGVKQCKKDGIPSDREAHKPTAAAYWRTPITSQPGYEGTDDSAHEVAKERRAKMRRYYDKMRRRRAQAKAAARKATNNCDCTKCRKEREDYEDYEEDDMTENVYNRDQVAFGRWGAATEQLSSQAYEVGKALPQSEAVAKALHAARLARNAARAGAWEASATLHTLALERYGHAGALLTANAPGGEVVNPYQGVLTLHALAHDEASARAAEVEGRRRLYGPVGHVRNSGVILDARSSHQECPECGARLMPDGTCPECGYGAEEGFHRARTANKFCATGIGGGVDPSCKGEAKDANALKSVGKAALAAGKAVGKAGLAVGKGTAKLAGKAAAATAMGGARLAGRFAKSVYRSGTNYAYRKSGKAARLGTKAEWKHTTKAFMQAAEAHDRAADAHEWDHGRNMFGTGSEASISATKAREHRQAAEYYRRKANPGNYGGHYGPVPGSPEAKRQAQYGGESEERRSRPGRFIDFDEYNDRHRRRGYRDRYDDDDYGERRYSRNAAPGLDQPRDGDRGVFLPHGAGTGKGLPHASAKDGYAATVARYDITNPEASDTTDDRMDAVFVDKQATTRRVLGPAAGQPTAVVTGVLPAPAAAVTNAATEAAAATALTGNREAGEYAEAALNSVAASGAMANHLAAYAVHAVVTENSSDEEAIRSHDHAARLHLNAARAYAYLPLEGEEEYSVNQSDPNSYEGTMTAEQRTRLIENLCVRLGARSGPVGNSRCTCLAEDRAALNVMSDTALLAVYNSVVRDGTVKPGENPADGPNELEEENMPVGVAVRTGAAADVITSQRSSGGRTTNSAAMQRWIASMPPEARPLWDSVSRTYNERKEALVQQLTSNQARQKLLLNESVEQLEERLALAQEYATNRGYPVSAVAQLPTVPNSGSVWTLDASGRPVERPAPAPLYTGAGGGLAVTNSSDRAQDDDVLVPPTINWGEKEDAA